MAAVDLHIALSCRDNSLQRILLKRPIFVDRAMSKTPSSCSRYHQGRKTSFALSAFSLANGLSQGDCLDNITKTRLFESGPIICSACQGANDTVHRNLWEIHCHHTTHWLAAHIHLKRIHDSTASAAPLLCLREAVLGNSTGIFRAVTVAMLPCYALLLTKPNSSLVRCLSRALSMKWHPWWWFSRTDLNSSNVAEITDRAVPASCMSPISTFVTSKALCCTQICFSHTKSR